MVFLATVLVLASFLTLAAYFFDSAFGAGAFLAGFSIFLVFDGVAAFFTVSFLTSGLAGALAFGADLV